MLPTGVLPNLSRLRSAHTPSPGGRKPRVRRGSAGKTHVRRGEEIPWTLECSANGQCSQRLHCLSTVRQYEVHLVRSIPCQERNVKPKPPGSGQFSRVIDATCVRMCRG